MRCQVRDTLEKHFANWKVNPRRKEIPYVLSRLLKVLRECLDTKRVAQNHLEPLDPPVETEYVNILYDTAFRRSLSQVKDLSCLDVARLANLWNLARLVAPGVFLEVGCYRGGTALHICNAIDHGEARSRFYCFDPFETGGFEKINDCDQAFKPTDFMDTQFEAVTRLLSSKPFAKVVQGFFPAAAEGMKLRDIAFCHLDVDVYGATRDSLEYLAPRLASRSIIVVDDVGHRETPGVERAMTEFVAAHPSFLAIPMFPCQAVLVPRAFQQS